MGSSLEVTCHLKSGWAYSDVKPWAEITQQTDGRYLKFGTQLPFVLVVFLPFFSVAIRRMRSSPVRARARSSREDRGREETCDFSL